MEELRFNCPKKLSQKFWRTCRDREETLGGALRNMMLREIFISDPEFREKVSDLVDDFDGDFDKI